MHRYKSFDEKLSKMLRDKEFAKEYILSLMEDHHLTPLEALKEVIRKMGVNEFSKLSGISQENISRMLHSKTGPKPSTLDNYYAPFGLKTKIILEEAA